MKINKRELLGKLVQANLWKNLSPEEVRLYLLLVIYADEIRGAGRLTLKVLERCLGSNLSLDQLKKAVHGLENLHLVKLDILPPGSEIEFEFLKGNRLASESKIDSQVN